MLERAPPPSRPAGRFSLAQDEVLGRLHKIKPLSRQGRNPACTKERRYAAQKRACHRPPSLEFPLPPAYIYFCTVVFLGSRHRSRRGGESGQIRRSTSV